MEPTISKIIANKKCYFYQNGNAGKCIIQPLDENELEMVGAEIGEIKRLTDEEPFLLVAVLIDEWNKELSPWDAPAVFGKEDFGCGAANTLSFITDTLIPYIHKSYERVSEYYLGGYSLAGLFSLWAGYQTDVFRGIAAVSPSVWFEGWDQYILSHMIKAEKTYLSLGDKESKTKNRVMATVADRIQIQSESLENKHILEWNSGNHFAQPDIRTAKGFAWLMNNLTEHEKYGEYFMNRSVSDIMSEYSEQHDEWH